MKKNITILLTIGLLLSACNYLDIVPDERPLDVNTYQSPEAARTYLYSCYSKMYNPRLGQVPDKFAAAEIMNPREGGIWESFPKGTYSPSDPQLLNDYYNSIWEGIHRCYEFLSIVDRTPGLNSEDLQYYKAEATLLIAYYHWLSFRAFGPSVIIDKLMDPLTPVNELPERSSVDEVVDFIDRKIAEAETIGLAERHDGDNYGRLTKAVAQALRAKVYLYAASPLFNGNSEFYSDFKSPIDNRHLISQTFDIEKWKKAESITRSAIQYLESLGFRLYTYTDAGVPSAQRPGPVDKFQRAVRYTFMDNVGGTNPEVIMVDTRQEDWYSIQNQSGIYQRDPNGCKNCWSVINPVLEFVEMFYTKNGLPIDEDIEFDYEGRYEIVDMPINYDNNNYSSESNGRTLKLNLDREPRFFSWIAFHNGNYEIAKYNGVITNSDPSKKVVKAQFRFGDPNGKYPGQTNEYTITGYLNKKFFHPAYESAPIQYPYPVIRMAELYLNLAEILIELDLNEGGSERLSEAKMLIDKIRGRAGVPTIDESWKKSKHPAKAMTAEGLREIVRYERQIEFYLENQRFWDLRRWKMADNILNTRHKGMNADGDTDEAFFKVVEIPYDRTFRRAQYLMPIPMDETNKVPQVVQNPYY